VSGGRSSARLSWFELTIGRILRLSYVGETNLITGAERPLEPADDIRLPRLTGILGPLVDAVARIKASVHTKLLAGFLVVALLLLGMAVVSQVVIERMSGRVDELSRLTSKIDLARQMEYEVTAQSHYRAMALLTKDPTNNEKIASAKQGFIRNLEAIEQLSPPPGPDFFSRVRAHNDQFTVHSAQVLALYQAGQFDQALAMHLGKEHPDSHLLEMDLRQLEQSSEGEIAAARAAYKSDKNLLTILVGAFTGFSVLLALLLGYVLSWSLIRPVRKIDGALARIASGDFKRRVQVPNRDEFGTLTNNLNATTQQLSALYDRHTEINNRLKRYVSPQLAESILAGSSELDLSSRRKKLTIFFSDIRGFTAIAERTEPEELIDYLNQYLSAMTEIVFRHGGTLDKYIGDAIMVFFGDPIPYEDHAMRAVAMALEMQAKLSELQREWFRGEEPLSVGMGISTGYVTVGNVGSSARIDYTVIGNHVNLAFQLAGTAKPGQILASERTLAACGERVAAQEVTNTELRGISRQLKIYEIRDIVKALLSGGLSTAGTAQTCCFMFTDVVGSTNLAEAMGDEAWAELISWHDVTLRQLFELHHGEEIDHAGDGFFVAFADAESAAECARQIQRRLRDHRRLHGFAPAVRIGLHSAAAQRQGSAYRGHGVHVAARVGAQAEAGQILASRASVLAEANVSKSTVVRVKGVSQPLELVEVTWR